MKKIFLGLFILGTLGIAQQNYEVYVKNGVKISQSEADRDSKEIDKIINDKEISFLEKNKAKVNVLVRYKDLDDIDTDEIIEEALKKSGITDKELDHFEKVSKAKIDKFYEYLENKIKEEIKDSDYSESTTEMEIEKVDGKWQVNFDYNDLINEMLKDLEDSFESMKNDIDD